MTTRNALSTTFGLLMAAILLTSISAESFGSPNPQRDFLLKKTKSKSDANSSSRGRATSSSTGPKGGAVKSNIRPKHKGTPMNRQNVPALRQRTQSSQRSNQANTQPSNRRAQFQSSFRNRSQRQDQVQSQRQNQVQNQVQNQSQTQNQNQQPSPDSQNETYSAEVRAEFVQLHADRMAEIWQRRNEMAAKLSEILQLNNTISGSQFVSLRSQIKGRVLGLQSRIGTYGASSVTTAQQIKLTIPNESLIDDQLRDLDDLVDELEDRADDADNDAMEDLADQLEDLVDDADRLEGRLTRKTNSLKRAWARKGGDVDYF